MYQLRNLINRTSVPTDPCDNMNSAEDYFLLLVHTHAIAAAKEILSYTSMDSVSDLAKAITTNFTYVSHLDFSQQTTEKQKTVDDSVHLYAVELLTLGLLWHGFHDAIKEGDGERIMRYWKFLLILFKSTNHPNYAKEAVNLLLQYNYLFSERQKSQLLWSRCVNTRGLPGTNIPCDLHMEHLNRRLKTVLRNMGANVNDKTVTKAGKCIAVVQRVCQAFEEQTSSTASRSDNHPYPKFGKDFDMVLNVLEQERVFTYTANRKHDTFSFSKGLLVKLSKKQLLNKVQTSIDQIYLV